MEIINAISIPFYKFKADPSLIKETYDDVVKLKFISENFNENGFVFHNYYNKNLFVFFNNCVSEFKKIYFNDDLEFPIVDCWVNKYGKMNKLNKHMHSNSIICGLYYVTSHTEKQSSTIFEAENPWAFVKPNLNSLNMTINKELVPPLRGEILPEEGTLILFPPSLYHYMSPITKMSEHRYTIAFNTFVSGNVSNHKSQILSIKSVTVEEKFGNK